MIIKSIELENIRSYKHELIEFNSGINFLSGDIGSGKSTILHAIEFALLGFKRGDLEGYQLLRKGELIGFVKLILLNSNNSEIEIFRKIKKGKTNNIISQENGYIKIKNNLIELSPQEINAKVFEFLNFPQEFINKDKNLIYRFTIYTAQEQLKEILFSDNEKKLEIIRKLFNIDKYKQLSNAISIFLTEMKSNKKVIESKIENSSKNKDEIINLKKEINKIELDINSYKNKEKPFKEKIFKYKNAILKREEFLKKSNEKILEIEKNLSTILEIEKNQKELEKNLNEKKTIQKKFSKIEIDSKKKELNNELKLFEKEIKNIEKEKLILKRKNENFKELLLSKNNYEKKLQKLIDLKNLVKSKEENFDYILTKCKLKDAQVTQKNLLIEIKKYNKLKSKLNYVNEEIIELNLVHRNLKNDLDEKKVFLKNISGINTCNTCLQKVDSLHKDKIIKKNNSEINEFIKKSKKYEKEIKLNKLEKNKLENDLEKLEKLEKNILEVNEKIKLLLDLEKSEKKLYDNLKLIKLEIKEFEKLNIKNHLEIILKDIEKISKDLEKEKKLLENEKNIFDKISQNKLENLKIENNIKELNNLFYEIKEIENKIGKNSEKIKKKNSEKMKLREINEKDIKIQNDKNKLNKILDQLYEKDKLISNKLSSLETEFKNKNNDLNNKNKLQIEIKNYENKFKLILYKENFLSEKVVKISSLIERTIFTKYYVEFNNEFERLFKDLIEDNEIDVRLDEEFSIIIEQNGYDIDIKNLSGGEKSSLAIAYRLGLKKIIENNLTKKQKLSLLILDEPTDGFSNQQIDRLGNILKDSDLKQIILVSHDNQIESIADNVLKVYKDNHISEVF